MANRNPTPLTNSRELFAKLLAAGATPATAYIDSRIGAEFACTIEQAQSLPGVRERVAYLRANPDAAPALAPPSDDLKIDPKNVTPVDVLKLLIRDHALAVQMGQSSAAVRAAELIGKQVGMFIDRQHVDVTILDKLEIHELRALAASLEDLAGEPERTPSGNPTAH